MLIEKILSLLSEVGELSLGIDVKLTAKDTLQLSRAYEQVLIIDLGDKLKVSNSHFSFRCWVEPTPEAAIGRALSELIPFEEWLEGLRQLLPKAAETGDNHG